MRKARCNMTEQLDVVIITGMSGAGKSIAMRSFEDMGYYCIDNLPPNLLLQFLQLIKGSDSINRVALVMDLRTRQFFDDLKNQVEKTREIYPATKLVFLDASDEELVARYKETRRHHPLAEGGQTLKAIQEERKTLSSIRAFSQYVIDTSDLSNKELSKLIVEKFADASYESFYVEVVSFGFKHGPILDADFLIDVRFLPNPHYIDDLRPKSGLDHEVYDYVMEQAETEEFYRRLSSFIDYLLPNYKDEGKSSVTIAIGCTGGKHRSVSLTERIGHHIKDQGYTVNITHRDCNHWGPVATQP